MRGISISTGRDGTGAHVAVTNAPVIINSFGDLDFVFNTRYDFTDRFNGEPDYFANRGEQKGLLLDTNFVPDAVNLPLISAKERGAGGSHVRFSMAKGHMNSHISQFAVGTYKKAHAHGPGAHVIILNGGFQPDVAGGREPQRFEWQGRLDDRSAQRLDAPAFNTGTTPARYLAFKAEGVAIRNAQGVPKRGSRSASEATRSTMLTSRRACAGGSRRRLPRGFPHGWKDVPRRARGSAAAEQSESLDWTKAVSASAGQG